VSGWSALCPDAAKNQIRQLKADCILIDGVAYYVSPEWREKSYKKIGVADTYVLILTKIQGKRAGLGVKKNGEIQTAGVETAIA
jgi:hypothetical protein